MKKALLTIVAIAAATNLLNAGTYTWTGAAGDGLWFTAGNWNYDDGSGNVTSPAATSPGNAPSDDVVIANGDTVSYSPGGDWMPTGTTTISGGSKLVQVSGGAWPNIQGALILDGGHYDSGSAGQIKVNAIITVRNGGSAIFPNTINADSVGSFAIETGGTVIRSGSWSGTIPLLMRGGWFECQGTFSNPNAGDEYTSGTIFVSSGEFQPPADTRFDLGGVDWIVRMISPRANGVPVLSGGSLTLFHTSNDGFYQMSGVHADFPAGSGATVTVPRAADEVYTRYFSNGKFTVAGATLSAAEFAEQIVVEAAEIPTNGTGSAYSTFRLAAVSPYGITSPAASSVGETSATISAFVSKTAEDGSVYALWGASAAATDDLSDWDHSEYLGAAVANETFSTALTGLTEEVLVYYAFAIVTNGVVAAATAVKSFTPSAYSAVFTGAAGDGLWETPGNWRDGVVPTESDTIRIDADCTRSGNLNLQNWNITVNGASFTATGELNPGPRTVLNGSITATTFIAGGEGNALVIRGSSVVATRTTNLGQAPRSFYGADPHFDFRSGAPCSYTYAYDPESDPPTFETEFNAIFVGGKILVDGVALTAADIGRVSYSTNTTDHTVTLTLLETAVNALFASSASASVNGLSATFSVPVEIGGAKPLYLLFGTDPANLSETLVVAEAADATTYTFTTNGVEGTFYHYQFRLGDADDPDAVFDSVAPQIFFASVSGNLFTGNVNEHANDARNWSKGAVPSDSDIVYVIADAAKRGTMQWDLENATVAGWVQIGERVDFYTTPANVLTIAGDVSLSSGANWTHAGPADEPQYCLNVSVAGDMSVGSGAIVQAGTAQENNSDYRPRGYHHGPGYLTSTKMVIDPITQEEVEETVYFGGSYAGDGGHVPYAGPFQSYGSILNPMEWGSAGKGDSTDNYSGPGLIVLTVYGNLTIDGSIASHGFGWDAQRAGASGGTVNITAARLSGNGSIDADGGRCLNGPGSGGRIRVKLTAADATFADFGAPAKIHANPGTFTNVTGDSFDNDVVLGSAGTVTLQLANDSAKSATVIVSDANQNRRDATDTTSLVSATHLPARLNPTENMKETRWELLGHGKLRLTADARIAALSLAADDGTQMVYTDGHVLTTRSLVVNGARLRAGVYDAAGTSWVSGSGSVRVSSGGFVFIIR